MEAPEGVEIDFMRGTRGGSYESWYHGAWTVQTPAGTELTVELRSLKGGVHRETVRVGGSALSRGVAGTAGEARGSQRYGRRSSLQAPPSQGAHPPTGPRGATGPAGPGPP